MATALNALAYDIIIEKTTKQPTKEALKKTRPAHHLNDNGTLFCNPWPSYRPQSPSQWLSFFFSQVTHSPDASPKVAAQVPSQTPTWGADIAPDQIKATWLGHACFLVEFPRPDGASRGPRMLFDPACSNRCSAVQWAGPARYTPLPCSIDDFPTIDAIVLSHNHYDHTDTPTLTQLRKRDNPHIFAPLGNTPYLSSIGIPEDHIHCLDWWEDRVMSLSLPSSAEPSQSNPVKSSFKFTCTPCQHVTARGPFDRWRTLWSSWAVEEVISTRAPKKVYFGGDTGYRTVRDGEVVEDQPVCPAFAEIGDKIGPFDLALIPIGAYSPRAMWSNLHAHPEDSVRIFKDVKAKKALGMHWGTWVLTTEPILEPPRLLKEEAQKIGIPDGDFDVCAIGETRAF